MRPIPSISDLRELFSYDPVTGVLTYRISKPGNWKIIKGRRASTFNKINGYRAVGINKFSYPEHRIVFAIFHGRWPQGQIDHINGVRDDNRIENLREATRSQNNQNKAPNKNKSSKGIRFYEATQKWQVRIRLNKISYCLGCYSDKKTAQETYNQKAKELFGEFARTIPT
jgi:hypothetical protein